MILAPLKELLQEMLTDVDKVFRTNPLTLLFCISILTGLSGKHACTCQQFTSAREVTRPPFGDSVCSLLVQEDEMLKQLQFFSVASDGRVTLWTLAKSELLHQVLPAIFLQVTSLHAYVM